MMGAVKKLCCYYFSSLLTAIGWNNRDMANPFQFISIQDLQMKSNYFGCITQKKA